MKLKVAGILILLVLVLALLSCVTSRDIHVEITCGDFAENPTSIPNDFNIEAGDKIYIELCSNRVAGFAWSYEMTGDAVKEEDHDYEEPESTVAGAAGTEKWTFEGSKKGTAEILVSYSQPWEGGIKNEWTYTITVEVK